MVFAVLSLASSLACLLSERAVVALSRVLGAFWWHVLRWRRRVIRENMAQAFPERTEEERAALGKSACIHLVQNLLEFLRIPRYAANNFDNVRIEGLEHYEAIRDRKKGVLCVTGHLGSFELAIAAIAARVRPISVVVKPLGRGFDRFVTGVRSGSGLALIPATHAVSPVLATLKRDDPVLFVLDQNATRKIGVFVDFFGRPASTMSALAVIALRSGAPILAATAHREPDGTHLIRVHPEIAVEHRSTREETIRHLTARCTRFIEDAIRAHPEQWLWIHKRWRTRPSVEISTRPTEAPGA